MSRKREYDDRVNTAVRMDREVHERLRAEANRRLVSVNLLIDAALRQALESWERQDLSPQTVSSEGAA